MDPRPAIITTRLAPIHRIIAVASGKGGVGKSMIAATTALTLTPNHTIGLMDLDVYGPTAHHILGTHHQTPTEDKGLIPPHVHNIAFMSPIFFTEEKPTPLRGAAVTDMILELLAVTQWGPLDYLILDMPPGIGDETLDVIRYLPTTDFLVITTPSKVATAAVDNLLDILQELHQPIIGVIDNMTTGPSPNKKHIEQRGLRYLGSIPYDPSLEAAIGDPEKLLKTPFAHALKQILLSLRG
jgi:ATP-binding protein involved in chromosome partitioning